MCSSALFLTSALEGGEGPASHSSRTLSLGKARYPLCGRLGASQGWSGQVQKISPHLDVLFLFYCSVVQRSYIENLYV